jgi:Rieske Fe-S protein
VEPRPGDEQPHTPSPSIWPVGFAVGIACILAGIVVSMWVAIVGAVIAVVFGALWARDAMAPKGHVEPAPLPEPLTPEEEEAEAAARYPRNKFLELTTLGLGGVITGIVALPIVGFAVLPAFTGQDHPGVDLGPMDNFPEDEWREVKFLLDANLGDVARRTAFIRYNGTSDEAGQPSFTIISNRCAHLGCPVQPNGPSFPDQTKNFGTGGGQEVTLIKMLPAGGFGCPCHGGQYDTEGNRTAGPPVRSLDRYEYAIDNGHLILGKTFSVAHVSGTGATAVIHKYRLAGPGQHIDGWEQIFYPLQPPH